MVLSCVLVCVRCFFFKQNTAYEMRISDWSSDVCSSDLVDDLCPTRIADVDDLVPHDVGRRPPPQLIVIEGVGEQRHDLALDGPLVRAPAEIGRASCRERGCQYV